MVKICPFTDSVYKLAYLKQQTEI